MIARVNRSTIGLRVTLRIVILCVLAVSALQVAQGPAWSEDSYPSKNIFLIVGLSAGGPTDSVARIIAPKLGELLGANIVIENKTGANTQIAVDYVSRQPADGYTLYLGSTNSTMLPVVNKSYTGDIANDLVGVTGIVTAPLIIVGSGVPVKNLKEFVEYSKANPGKLNWATAGASDILQEKALVEATGLDAVVIPYPGQAQLRQALLAKQVNGAWFFPGDIKQFVDSGAVQPLAATGKTRIADFPDAPTVAESGYDFETFGYNGLLARQGTPQPIIDKIYNAMKTVLQDEQVKMKLKAYGFEISGTSPAEFSEFWKAQIAKWTAVAKRTGFTAN